MLLSQIQGSYREREDGPPTVISLRRTGVIGNEPTGPVVTDGLYKDDGSSFLLKDDGTSILLKG